jgi:hypothetical protein
MLNCQYLISLFNTIRVSIINALKIHTRPDLT